MIVQAEMHVTFKIYFLLGRMNQVSAAVFHVVTEEHVLLSTPILSRASVEVDLEARSVQSIAILAHHSLVLIMVCKKHRECFLSPTTTTTNVYRRENAIHNGSHPHYLLLKKKAC